MSVLATLQKILWRGEVHTPVSAEAIRWAIRWHWQRIKGEDALIVDLGGAG